MDDRSRTSGTQTEGSTALAERPEAELEGRGERAQPPEALVPLRLEKPRTSAGGLPAVLSTTKHTLTELGAVRGAKLLLEMNKTHGFDCPGCAWPDPDDRRSLVEFCENGAKALAEEATVKRITPEFFARHSVAELSQQTDHWLGKQGRLTHPMVLREGATHYTPIGWDEAFALIAEELNALDSPDEALFYTSGRTSNEAAFLYQLFVRQYGTNNLPDCSNMCHESSGTGLNETIGVGKGTVTLDDFSRADAIFVVGQNPGTNHPRMLTALQDAARKGAKIVSINPLPEAGLIRFKHPQQLSGLLGSGTPLASLFLQVKINGDVALLQGLAKALLEAEERSPGSAIDRAFVESKTSGFEAWAAHIREVSWDAIVEGSGVPLAKIREGAELLQRSERIIFCWAMGLTQHRNGVANVQEIVNLLLMRGSFGKPGAGVCPVRGHSNVQGDRTMGIWEKPPAAFLDRLGREFGFEPPRAHGMDTVAAIEAMHAGRAKVLFAMGGNFLSAAPDTEFTAAALRRCQLTAHVSTKLNRSHLVAGRQALILPCLARSERDVQGGTQQFVTVENSMGVVHSSRGGLNPASEHLLSEPVIVARLAKAVLGDRTSVDWDHLVGDYDRIRDRIARVIPGFEDFNARVRKPGGFYLPNVVREGGFGTPDGKGRFTVHRIPQHKLEPGQLLMMTIRSHDQYNTTIYGLQDRYRGIGNERRVVLLNREDLALLGLEAGQVVDLVSHFEGEQRIARKFVTVTYDIPRGCAATYFPEANVLVPVRNHAEKSRTPASKSVVISLRPAATA